MTREELARHNGKDGQRAYIAVNGTIYDVTDSPRCLAVRTRSSEVEVEI